MAPLAIRSSLYPQLRRHSGSVSPGPRPTNSRKCALHIDGSRDAGLSRELADDGSCRSSASFGSSMGFDDDEAGILRHCLERRHWPPVRTRHCMVERLDGVCRVEVAQQQGAARPQDPRELSNRRRDARRVVVDGGEPRQDAAEFVVRFFDRLDAAVVESHAGIGCARAG